jgi:hypothetical protein
MSLKPGLVRRDNQGEWTLYDQSAAHQPIDRLIQSNLTVQMTPSHSNQLLMTS